MSDKKKFTIEVEMEERWIIPFLSMLDRIQWDGNVGHSEIVGIYADGDGDFRPKFKVNGEIKVDGINYNINYPLPKLKALYDSMIFDADYDVTDKETFDKDCEYWKQIRRNNMDKLRWEKNNDIEWDRLTQSYRTNIYYCWRTEDLSVAEFYEKEKGKFHYIIHGNCGDRWEYDLEENSRDIEIVKERLEKLVRQTFSNELEFLTNRANFYKEMFDKMN